MTTSKQESALLLEIAAREFVRKVDAGEAKSKRSYAAFKEALEVLEREEQTLADEAPPHPMWYDIVNDQTLPVTQEDWDEMQKLVWTLHLRPESWPCGEQPLLPKSLRLACFPSRHRVGEVFIAEDLEITPAIGSDGNVIYRLDFASGASVPYYPATPRTQWVVPNSMNAVLGMELVRRWNRVADQAAAEEGRKDG